MIYIYITENVTTKKSNLKIRNVKKLRNTIRMIKMYEP